MTWQQFCVYSCFLYVISSWYREESNDISWENFRSSMVFGDLLEQVEEGLWEEVSDDGAALSGHIDYELDDSVLWQECESVAVDTMLGAPPSSQSVQDSWTEEESERVQGEWISVAQVPQTEDEQDYKEHPMGVVGTPQLEQEDEPQPTIEREPVTRRKHRKGVTGQRPVLSRSVLNRSLAEAAETPLFFCAVCCQLLFRNETCSVRVSVAVQRVCAREGEVFSEEHHVPWPCTHYGRSPTRKNGEITTCKAHQRVTLKVLEYVSVENLNKDDFV